MLDGRRLVRYILIRRSPLLDESFAYLFLLAMFPAALISANVRRHGNNCSRSHSLAGDHIGVANWAAISQ
jgi:hypothetical protein